jgi:hypothetical protein
VARLDLIALVAVVGGGAVAAVAWYSPPEPAVPAVVEPYLDDARELARAYGGLVSYLPLRLDEVRCQVLGRGASLAFASPLGRTFVIVNVPPEGVADPPEATVSIAPITVEEHVAFGDACP